MNNRLVIYTQPSVEPVSLTEAKAQLRLDTSDHDTLVSGLIKGARQYLEEILNRAFISQVWDLYLDEFPGATEIVLPKSPLASVAGVYYTPDGSSEATFAASNYQVDAYSEPGRIVLKDTASWPGDSLQNANGVRVRFTAGYGTSSTNVPEPLRQAMLLLISQWYDNPVSYEVGPVMATPFSVKALIAPYKIVDY